MSKRSYNLPAMIKLKMNPKTREIFEAIAKALKMELSD